LITALVNGNPAACVAIDDRGLLYADGLFETMLVEAGRPQLWNYHLERLGRGCQTLKLDLPDTAVLLDEIARLGQQSSRCVVRLLVTRGSGGRGYTPPREQSCNRIVQAFPVPETSQELLKAGVELGFSALRLSSQGLVAGIKHLGRLEQVLARAQLVGSSLPDALMLDEYGRLVESTQANVFLLHDGRWWTPRLAESGVAGVFRAFLLDHMAVRTDDIFSGSLHRFESMFLCNSVRGILPVRALQGVGEFDVGPCLALRNNVLPVLAGSHLPKQKVQ
jgi:4-amino-4-deoxychorismate lyase